MEELYIIKDALITKLKDPKNLKKTPAQVRLLRNEINDEFNIIIKQIMCNRRKNKTKKKKYLPPRILISDSSCEE